MSAENGLITVLKLLGETVIKLYSLFEFTIFGLTINALDVILWFTLAYFFIDRIKDLLDW